MIHKKIKTLIWENKINKRLVMYHATAKSEETGKLIIIFTEVNLGKLNQDNTDYQNVKFYEYLIDEVFFQKYESKEIII